MFSQYCSLLEFRGVPPALSPKKLDHYSSFSLDISQMFSLFLEFLSWSFFNHFPRSPLMFYRSYSWDFKKSFSKDFSEIFNEFSVGFLPQVFSILLLESLTRFILIYLRKLSSTVSFGISGKACSLFLSTTWDVPWNFS